jgi:Transposase IS116/IS110/IS902 family
MRSNGWPKSPVSGSIRRNRSLPKWVPLCNVSWVGACSGEEESAGVNRSKRSPKGNRQLRRILNQAANAAVKRKESTFEIVYRRLVLRLGHNKTIEAIAHRLCQLIWIILHNGVRYEERGPAVSEKSKRLHTTQLIRTLRMLGYRVEPLANPA